MNFNLDFLLKARLKFGSKIYDFLFQTVPPGTPPPIDAKISYPECSLKADGKFDSTYMDYCSDIDKVCRPQFTRRPFNFTDAKNQIVEKCCCEYNKDLPQDPNAQPIFAPVCSISAVTKDVARWSMARGGPDLVCKEGFKIYTVDVPMLSQKGQLVPHSCCLPEAQILPDGVPGLRSFNYLIFLTFVYLCIRLEF